MTTSPTRSGRKGKAMTAETPSFFGPGDREYTHRMCPNRHTAKVRKDHDWSEQDVCPRCDEMYDMYDPIRKRTAAQDQADDERPTP